MHKAWMMVGAFAVITGQHGPPSSAARLLAVDTTTVRGTVFDSLAKSPLAGALIQIVPADSSAAPGHFTATSDSAGRFVIPEVPAGQYVIGFYHVALDTLGIELPGRLLTVRGGEVVAALGTPSATTIIAAFCGALGSHRPDTLRSSTVPTLLIGHVRDVRTEAAIESASVNISWAGVEPTPEGLTVVERHATAHTRASGFFALCGLPPDISLSASSARAADSSGRIALRLPSAGFLHVTLTIGGAGRHGRVVGRVTDTATRPVATAQLTIGDRTATTSENGSFVLDGVGVGSQSVEVRALGYAPRLDVIQVAENRPTEFAATLERVVALPAVVSNESAAAANLAQYLHDKRTDASGATFVEPIRMPGYKSQQSACQLISAATRLDFCRTDRPFFCQAIFVNGAKTRLRIDDIDPDDIIGVEGFGHGPPARYVGITQVCPFVIWTRCAGATIPTCGDNPASRPTIDRPKAISGRKHYHAEAGAHFNWGVAFAQQGSRMKPSRISGRPWRSDQASWQDSTSSARRASSRQTRRTKYCPSREQLSKRHGLVSRSQTPWGPDHKNSAVRPPDQELNGAPPGLNKPCRLLIAGPSH